MTATTRRRRRTPWTSTATRTCRPLRRTSLSGQRPGIDVAKTRAVNAYVRDTASTGGAGKIDNPTDAKMAAMALDFDPREFGSIKPDASNDQGTWDKGDQN